MVRRRYKIFAALCWLPLAAAAVFMAFVVVGLSGHGHEPPTWLVYLLGAVVVGMPLLGLALLVAEMRHGALSLAWQIPVWISALPLALWLVHIGRNLG